MSLSKLALLASSEEEEEGEKEEKVRRLNDQLHHIAVQQSLPEEILEVYVRDVKLDDIIIMNLKSRLQKTSQLSRILHFGELSLIFAGLWI